MVLTEIIKKDVSPNVKEYYSDILCQEFSPCGNFLIAGSIFGDLHVFDLRLVLNPPEESLTISRKPALTFSLPITKAACSLATTPRFLIVGSVGKVFGYDWKAIVAGKIPKLSWSWELPSLKDELEAIEANAMVVSDDGKVYVGCGDNKIHVFSLEDGRMVRTMSGHEGYIHDLTQIDVNQLASAGEDGTVRLWDRRTASASRGFLEPHKNDELERPSLGKWVGSVFVDKEWLVCGGGVRAGLFHIPSMQMTSTFHTEDLGIHVTFINEERVFVGSRLKLDQFNLVGDQVGSISSSSLTQLSLAYRETPQQILSVSGTSKHLDICTNLDCRDQVLDCC